MDYDYWKTTDFAAEEAAELEYERERLERLGLLEDVE